MIRFNRKILVYKLYMDYDRDMGHSLQIYLLCAAIHLMSIISLAFTYSALLNKGVLQINVPGCNQVP